MDTNDLKTYIKKYLAFTSIAKEDVITSEIENLEKTVESFKTYYDSGGIGFQFKTDDIVLENVFLGKFNVKVILDYSLRIVVQATPETNKYCSKLNTSISHPHVAHDSMCLGEVATMGKAALRDGRLDDAYTIVNNALHTYNENSPHVALKNWNGYICENCLSSGREQARQCNYCPEFHCQNCRKSCRSCDSRYHHSDEVECCKCKKENCPGCIDGIAKKHGKIICNKCKKFCNKCNVSLFDTTTGDYSNDLYCEPCKYFICIGCYEKTNVEEYGRNERCRKCVTMNCSRCGNYKPKTVRGICNSCTIKNVMECI